MRRRERKEEERGGEKAGETNTGAATVRAPRQHLHCSSSNI